MSFMLVTFLSIITAGSHVDHLWEILLNYCDKNGLVISAPNSLARYVCRGNWTTNDITLLNNTPFHFDLNHILAMPSDHLPIEFNIDCNFFLPFSMYHFDYNWKNFANTINESPPPFGDQFCQEYSNGMHQLN